MNLLELDPFRKINIDEIDESMVKLYQLTLPYYYAYQLIATAHQHEFNSEYQEYLNKHFIKKEENEDFRHGVIDAFCEIVKSGVKKIAFSHATDNLDYFASDLCHVITCSRKYGIYYYVEENLIETCLFHNSGSRVIILYRDKNDINDYLKLKDTILKNKKPTHDELVSYGRELGRLLSYHPSRIEAMIEDYFNH